jgi:hypothetical protein
VTSRAGVYAYAANKLPAIGDLIEIAGAGWTCEVDRTEGTDDRGAIYCTYRGEVGVPEVRPA